MPEILSSTVFHLVFTKYFHQITELVFSLPPSFMVIFRDVHHKSTLSRDVARSPSLHPQLLTVLPPAKYAVWWCGGRYFTTSFCSYFLPFRVLILHILVLVVFAMLANNNWLPEDNGRKVTSLEAQTPFCHIFFRKNLIPEEILYISEQSTTTANMMSKLIVRVLSFKMVLVIVVCISSLPRNEKKIL